MYEIKTEGGKIKSWCAELEKGAIEQATNVANHPNIFKHVALMPDCHQGYGMPIGGVCALKGAISPAMVGYDIGCGMRAIRTNIKDISKSQLETLKTLIKRSVPVGTNYRQKMPKNNLDFGMMQEDLLKTSEKFSNNYMKSVGKSLGTLGGGKRNDCFQTKRII